MQQLHRLRLWDSTSTSILTPPESFLLILLLKLFLPKLFPPNI